MTSTTSKLIAQASSRTGIIIACSSLYACYVYNKYTYLSGVEKNEFHYFTDDGRLKEVRLVSGFFEDFKEGDIDYIIHDGKKYKFNCYDKCLSVSKKDAYTEKFDTTEKRYIRVSRE